MSLEEFHNAIDYFYRSVQNMCVRCRNFYEIIRSSVLDFLTDFLHLEVHCFWSKGDRSCDIGHVLMGIVDNSVEHCVWV